MIEVELPFPPPELNPNRSKGRHWTAEEDAFLERNWEKKSHADMAQELNRPQAGVRNRCWRLGLVTDGGAWSEDELALLRRTYESAKCGAEIQLDKLAKSLGRHKSNICRKARALGLTDMSREKMLPEDRNPRVAMFSCDKERSKYQSARAKEWLRVNGHPRGMLGKRHSDEVRESLSKSSAAYYASLTEEERAAKSRKMMKTRAKNGTYAPIRRGTTWKAAWREIGGYRKYFRSRWEANYARYLQWLKEQGQIAEWAHEPTTFWFEGIKRGTCSYLPDFLVTEKDGSQTYYEVKGWMDDRSKTKLKRMAKYHPAVKLIVVREKEYKAIAKSVGALIEGWE